MVPRTHWNALIDYAKEKGKRVFDALPGENKIIQRDDGSFIYFSPVSRDALDKAYSDFVELIEMYRIKH